MKSFRILGLLAGGSSMMVAALVGGAGAEAQSATAISPYTLTLFPGTPPAAATQPDDLAVSADGKRLWVGYGNGVDTTGKGGPSNLVEYDIATGRVLKNISIPGHLDGLKINPATGDVWATENEDGNPTLAVIEHENGTFKIYRFPRPPAGSGSSVEDRLKALWLNVWSGQPTDSLTGHARRPTRWSATSFHFRKFLTEPGGVLVGV
jgi:hypothetical protein